MIQYISKIAQSIWSPQVTLSVLLYKVNKSKAAKSRLLLRHEINLDINENLQKPFPVQEKVTGISVNMTLHLNKYRPEALNCPPLSFDTFYG
jgi:hypothetical protein